MICSRTNKRKVNGQYLFSICNKMCENPQIENGDKLTKIKRRLSVKLRYPQNKEHLRSITTLTTLISGENRIRSPHCMVGITLFCLQTLALRNSERGFRVFPYLPSEFL